ncbi:MAG: LemA family protein [Ideonella sp. WA131b]|nr:LemA family protein [Ideonella sp. WA131b]
MTSWLLLALGALLLFWVVGANNRLIALRDEVCAAWQRVVEALQPRDAAAEPLVALLRSPMAAEQGALDAFVAATAQSRQAGAALGARPLDPTLAQQWQAAESALAGAASRLLALLEQQPDLRADALVAPLLAAWNDAQPRLAYARQRFNEAAEAHDAAIALFPTTLLARALGMAPAGRL